jgi:uncharacterized membrane protein YgdD (TMEM256/DUF423 family)
MAQLFGLIGALYGAAGVMLGAFGAHALRDSLTPRQLETWQTAVSYQMTHALALLAVFLLMRHGLSTGVDAGIALKIAGWAFLLGVLLFSGSLYALCFGAPGVFGPITPLGGVSFIIGWIALAWAIFTFHVA